MADSETASCPNCERLNRRIRTLEQQVAELKGYVFGRHHKQEGPSRKHGAPEGHPGWFRSRPTTADRIEDVTLNACPRCGSKELSVCQEVEEHLQEDLVLPEPQTTLYRKHVYWCKTCGKKVRGRGKDELPGSYVGPNAKSAADFLRYKVKVTQRDITRIFKGLFHLSVSPAAIQGFHTQTRNLAQPLHHQLHQQLLKEPALWADETSAPVDGNLFWCWLFASKRISLYHIAPSRGSGVVHAVLGKTYAGILTTDFLSVYHRRIQAFAKQKCLTHLNRDLDKLLKLFPAEDPVFVYARRLRDFFQEARAFYDVYREGKLTLPQLQEQSSRFNAELPSFIHLQASQPDIRRLSKRLIRHQNELLTFLDYPDLLSPDNNYAERLIRPCVIFRKLTGGFRSKTGTDNHNVLMSLQQTAHLNNKDPLQLFRNILTAKPHTLTLDACLSP